MDAAVKELPDQDLAFWQSRYSTLQQRLIDTNNQFDKALASFRRVNQFFSNALHINDKGEVPELVTEAVVDVFEMEFGVFFLLGRDGLPCAAPVCFGVSLAPSVLETVATAILLARHDAVAGVARRLDLNRIDEFFPAADLGHAMYVFCAAPDGTETALLVVGNTKKGARFFFSEPTEQTIEVLALFGRQVGSLLDALEKRVELIEKKREIERREILFEAAARAQHQAELVAELSLSPELAEGRVDDLSAVLARAVCDRVGLASVGIWLLDEESGRIRNLVTCDSSSTAYARLAPICGLRTAEELRELVGVRILDATTPGVGCEEEMTAAGVTASLDAVVRVVGEAVGVVHFEQTAPGATWDQRDHSFACLLADQIALCISNAHRKRTEEALEAAAVEATQLARIAEAANRAKSEFLANMSHELRTPLNAILALAEGMLELARGPLTDLQVNALSVISSSGRHLLSLINDVLDLAKVEAGRLEVLPERMQAAEVCAASVAMVRELAAAGKVSLKACLPDAGLELYADPRRLKQMLVNLLINAVKFTPPGGHATLEAKAVPAQGAVAFSVSDTGIGISPEGLARLFTPFTQLDAGLNRSREGTGLGLTLVRRLAELHGGSVTAESNLGEGSKFTVLLPVTCCGAPPPETHETGQDLGLSEDGDVSLPENSGLRVLLAEDNEANIEAFSSYLVSKGFNVSVARNGIEAIGRATELHPDLILMDVQMPEMDGLSATRHIRKIPHLAKIPVVALTALAMPGDRERCIEAGMNAYLTKPVPLGALLRCMVKCLEARSK